MTQMENGSMRWAAVVLAAGKGSRMKTALPKALHKVGGKRMIDRVLEAVADAGITDTTIVCDLSPTHAGRSRPHLSLCHSAHTQRNRRRPQSTPRIQPA